MSRRIRPTLFACLLALSAVAAPHAFSAEALYEKQLLRLAEVLGSIHYLRNLCGEDGERWRREMEALLDAENPGPARRAALVARFNHGYRSYKSSYKRCTPSAVEVIRRYMKEGAALSSDIVTRYGN